MKRSETVFEREGRQPMPAVLRPELVANDVAARALSGAQGQPSSNAWYRTLPPEKKRALRELHRIDLRYNWIGLAFAMLWAVAGWVAYTTPSWGIRILSYIAAGFLVHGLGNLMHEGIHRNLFRRGRLDRGFAFLFGAPVMASAAAYEVVHQRHHVHERGEEDPDELLNLTERRGVLKMLFYAWILFGMFFFVLIRLPYKALQLGSARERRRVLLEYVALLLIYAGVFAVSFTVGAPGVVLHAWLVPVVVAGFFGNVRGWAEHMMTEPGHPLTRTRTVTSNRLLSFINLNLNYHLEHHLFPGVPWYNLPKVHCVLQDEYREAGAFVYTSYRRFLWDAFRTGVFGKARDRSASALHPSFSK